MRELSSALIALLPCGHGGPLPAVRLTKRSSGRHFTRMYAFGVPLDRDAAQLPQYTKFPFALRTDKVKHNYRMLAREKTFKNKAGEGILLRIFR